jgi:hypothetical protein
MKGMSLMARISKVQVLKLIALGVICGVVLAILGQCANSAASAATQSSVTIKKLTLNEKGQPRVKITASQPIEILFSQPNSDSTEDDLVRQDKGTMTYTLRPRVKPGAKAGWYVTVFKDGGPDELANEYFVWKRPHLDRFVWQNVENPAPTACPKGRNYTFWLQSKPETRYLTAQSKLRLQLMKPDGQVVTRKLDLAFGDGDLVWMSHVGARTTVLKAWVKASWRGKRPWKKVDFFCVGS